MLENLSLIGISGVKNSGKTEVTNILQYCLSVPKIFRQYWIYKRFGKLFHKSWKVLAFADPMKKMLSVLLNTPVEKFNDRTFKEDYCIDLESLDYHYSAYVKDKYLLSDSKFNKMAKELDSTIKHYDLTIRQLMQFFATNICRTYFGENVWINSTLRHATDKTIISDCRFINEARAIKSNGGLLIYVNRPTATFGQHQSEKEMKQMLDENRYDIIIDNDGSIEDLFNSVKNVVETY